MFNKIHSLSGRHFQKDQHESLMTILFIHNTLTALSNAFMQQFDCTLKCGSCFLRRHFYCERLVFVLTRPLEHILANVEARYGLLQMCTIRFYSAFSSQLTGIILS